MARYEFRYIKESTGRSNKGEASAFDEEELRANLAAKNIVPLDVVRRPEQAATERQLEYLRSLGVSVVGALNINEASDLISNALDKRIPADGAAQAIAARYRIETTRFTSKESVYRRVVERLVSTEDYASLAEWYAFRIYRDRCNRDNHNLLDNPSDERFRKIGDMLLANDAALKSLKQSANSTTTGFRWFGNYMGNMGDSDRTTAFKLAVDALIQAGLISSVKRQNRSLVRRAGAESSAKSGCLGFFLVGVFGVIALVATLQSSL